MRFFAAFLLLVIMPAFFAFGQKTLAGSKKQGVYAEFFSDSAARKVYIFYRVDHDALIYNKTAGAETARFSVTTEISDSAGKEYFREIKEQEISGPCPAWPDPVPSTQGLLISSCNNNSFSLKITFTDLNTGREIRKMLLPLQGNQFFKPNIERQEMTSERPIVIAGNANTTDNFVLCNFDGALPFSSRTYSLLIKSSRKADKPVLKLVSKDTSISFPSEKCFHGIPEYRLEDGKAILSIKKDSSAGFFYLFEDVSKSVFPGTYKAVVTNGNDTLFNRPNALTSVWFNSPESFRDPRIALKILDIIEVDTDSLLAGRGEDESMWKVVFKYWGKYDPTPGTAYNELMEEFYLRADYANSTYCTFRGNDGLNTDRGKVFLRFGKPAKVDRVNTSSGKLGEIWNYKDGRTFYFVDLSGTGNYEIVKGL